MQPSSLRVVWSNNVLTISYVTNKGDESSDVPGGSPNAMPQSLELHLSASIMDPTIPGSGYKLLCSEVCSTAVLEYVAQLWYNMAMNTMLVRYW